MYFMQLHPLTSIFFLASLDDDDGFAFKLALAFLLTIAESKTILKKLVKTVGCDQNILIMVTLTGREGTERERGKEKESDEDIFGLLVSSDELLIKELFNHSRLFDRKIKEDLKKKEKRREADL
ncbi:hypothetical protein C1646_667012 [Rhizophagus diaphanus]|nr:hypothetical protein C1646_667012 [Rhizophagus diaphanus] [Rhizophagus sp. MUCL 43196]